MRFLVTGSRRLSPRFLFFVRRCFQVNPQSVKIRSERSGAPRRCVLRAQLPEMERPFAGMPGLNQPRGGGGRRRRGKKEEVKDEARRWVSEAREKGESVHGGEALQRRGGTGEDAHRSSRARALQCTCAHQHGRAILQGCGAPPCGGKPSCLRLFIYSFIHSFFRLFDFLTQKVPRWNFSFTSPLVINQT